MIILNNIISGESGCPSILPDFSENALSVSPFSIMLAMDFLYVTFIMLIYVPVYP